MKIDHAAREEAKRKRMAHPDWHKYSGFPPDGVIEDKPKKKGKQAEPITSEPETDENGDGN